MEYTRTIPQEVKGKESSEQFHNYLQTLSDKFGSGVKWNKHLSDCGLMADVFVTEQSFCQNLACTFAAREMLQRGFCPIGCNELTAGQYVHGDPYRRSHNVWTDAKSFTDIVKENPTSQDYSVTNLQNHTGVVSCEAWGRAKNAKPEDNPALKNNPLYQQYISAMERQSTPFKPKKKQNNIIKFFTHNRLHHFV